MDFRFYTLLYIACFMLCSCSHSGAQTATDAPKIVEHGQFVADSAFSFVAKQVEFGPRIPGSNAHRACADWLITKLDAFGADTVIELTSSATAWDGTKLPVRNIFAQFNPEVKDRIILLAHYDSRPWADHDPDRNNRHTPIDGANDGASGVGVLLEVARSIGKEHPQVGVDILFTDAEDYGTHADAEASSTAGESDSWCLGSQAFASQLPYSAENRPRFGILLDMVGGRDARFNREYFSVRSASAATAKVWAAAEKLGLSERFPKSPGGAITDDHIPLIRAGIPVTDIIECNARTTGSFPDTWHTLNDNIENIDLQALADVGRVVLYVVYSEKP